MDYLIAILGIALLGGVWISVERLAGKQSRELEKVRCTGCEQDCQSSRRT